MEVLLKQPAEALKRNLPFPGAAAITAIVSVTAASRGLVAGSQPLTVSGELVGGMLFVRMSGGTDGERYLVTAKVTAGDETLEGELDVAVIDAQWATPDGGGPYLTIAEFVERFTFEEVVRMADTDGSGRIDRAFLVNALAAVQAKADVYISARYTVPLGAVPEIVKVAIADMARARLYPRGAPEGVGDDAKAAEKLLEKISDGRLPLPSASALPEAASAAPILIAAGKRQYPDGLEGY